MRWKGRGRERERSCSQATKKSRMSCLIKRQLPVPHPQEKKAEAKQKAAERAEFKSGPPKEQARLLSSLCISRPGSWHVKDVSPRMCPQAG